MKNSNANQDTLGGVSDACNNLVGSTLGISQDDRLGDDGAFGRSLEKALGVEENNRAGADIVLKDGNIELKTTNGKSKMTLFSKEPIWMKQWFSGSRDFFKRFSKCGIRLNTSIKSGPNNLGLYLQILENRLIIMHNDRECGYWELDALLEHAGRKLDRVFSLEHEKGKIKKFHKYSGMSCDNFVRLVKSGDLVVEIRISKGGKKNRGTAFRINPRKVEKKKKKTSGVQ